MGFSILYSFFHEVREKMSHPYWRENTLVHNAYLLALYMQTCVLSTLAFTIITTRSLANVTTPREL